MCKVVDRATQASKARNNIYQAGMAAGRGELFYELGFANFDLSLLPIEVSESDYSEYLLGSDAANETSLT